MKLHANARTCPNSRKLLVRRIEEEGWSLMRRRPRPPASASEPPASGWPLARRGRGRPCSTAPRRPGGAHRDCPSDRSRRSRRCAGCG